MSKYSSIPLKPHKARVQHICYKCGKIIQIGENVYYQSDRFLQNLSKKKFCKECFKAGDELRAEARKGEVRLRR